MIRIGKLYSAVWTRMGLESELAKHANPANLCNHIANVYVWLLHNIFQLDSWLN